MNINICDSAVGGTHRFEKVRDPQCMQRVDFALKDSQPPKRLELC